MKLVKGMLMGIGAIALVASLLNLVAPKAVHGAVAALVDVANTTAAPALTLDISKSASQHVELSCAPAGCFLLSSFLPYVVPAGQNLVVTSVDISTECCAGNAQLNIDTGSTGEGWLVPNDTLTHSFQYPSGIVYPAGVTFNSTVVSMNANVAFVFLEGFLTPIYASYARASP